MAATEMTNARAASDLEALLDGLAAQDPNVRVDCASRELIRGIDAGQWEHDIATIRHRLTEYFSSDIVWAKAAATRVLNALANAGHFNYEDYLIFRAWYVTEEDTRGFVADIGPIMAVGNGAEYVETCVRLGLIPALEGAAIISCRLRAAGGVWHDAEGVRLAHAACTVIGKSTSPHVLEVWSTRLADTVLNEAVRHGNRAVIENFAHFLNSTGRIVRTEPKQWGISTERAKFAQSLIAGLEEQLRTASGGC
ncbi:hypothetical protein QP922_03480 [Corynebacterium sp. MSK218]|uniref:hypothetical protein n=1 Tax=Corynebacterium sp. MSK218 TaxID=3050218 RepID=UPI002550D922|nr:hypothetical protein [Corynebacterium sp. MSK218]MDK8762886.1 hypothetical protein [Corynebacterium sp. MSK218]